MSEAIIVSRYREAARDAAERDKRRRARVLTHPDIAKHLTAFPLRFSTPEAWSGYVPPGTGDYGPQPAQPKPEWPAWSVERSNNSPFRVALMDILRAVAEREAERDAA